MMTPATDLNAPYRPDGNGGIAYREIPIGFPGLEPEDRTPRLSTGYRSILAPGLDPGDVAEWREGITTYDGNADPNTRNTCIFRGWNLKQNCTHIDPDFGYIGGGEEHCFELFSGQPKSESHPVRWAVPGGIERRLIHTEGEWVNGQSTTYLRGTQGSIEYAPADGSAAVSMLGWLGNNLYLGGLTGTGTPLLVQTNNYGFLWQFEAGHGYYIRLPYVNASNQVAAGHDGNTGLIPDFRHRGAIIEHRAANTVAAPGAGTTALFVDSADGALKLRTPGGALLTVTTTP